MIWDNYKSLTRIGSIDIGRCKSAVGTCNGKGTVINIPGLNKDKDWLANRIITKKTNKVELFII